MSTDIILTVVLLAIAGVAGCILWLTALDACRARWLEAHPEEAEQRVLARIARRRQS